MYVTIKEAAEYLSMHEAVVENLIFHGRIRALHDGEQHLINLDQFKTHMDQLEKYRELIEEILNEPIPEDIDVKDED